MGWRSSSLSSSSARCAAALREILDLILTTRSPRTGWSSRGLTVARYRPLRMCRWSMMWSCSTSGIHRVPGCGGMFVGGATAGPRERSVDRAGPRLRSAACSTARNLAVAVLRLAVAAAVPVARARPGRRGAVVPAPEASWPTSAVTTPALTMPAITQDGAPCSQRPCPPRRVLGLGRQVNPPWVLGAVVLVVLLRAARSRARA